MELPRKEIALKTLTLAADARLSRTDYTDDQSWDVRLGGVDSPAVALQTRYGGRAGLVSLVPMWTLYDSTGNQRSLYETQGYKNAPRIVGFAPGCAHLEGRIVDDLDVIMHVWVMESHAVGMRTTLTNTGSADIRVRMDIYGHVIKNDKEQKLAIVSLKEGGSALSLGQIEDIQPAVMVDNGGALMLNDSHVSARVGTDVTVAAGETVSLRFVHAGRRDLRTSLALAQDWLAQDWEPYFEAIAQAAKAIPDIHIGHEEVDHALAVSYQYLMQSFIKPTGSLPFTSFVANRSTGYGWSRTGDGTDHPRSWSGQPVMLSYLVALGLGSIDPELSEGILHNYLAIQMPNGEVDGKPGLAGQRSGLNAAPLLARLALKIFRYTSNDTFLKDTFAGLTKFYLNWFEQDPDNFPQWQDERQMGYTAFPVFGQGFKYAQNADIRAVESLDMATYLLSEAISLKQIARRVGSEEFEEKYYHNKARSEIILNDLWQGDRYMYRECDTHRVSKYTLLLDEAPADQEHFITEALPHPARLVVRITGGTSKTPALTLTIDGVDRAGNPIKEVVSPPAFHWYRGFGVYTTKHVYKSVDRVQVEGLSRVYVMRVTTLDTTHYDINALLPIASMGITTERAAHLVTQITNNENFWREYGVTIIPAGDPNYDPTHENGGGGVWPFWTTMLGEGLWDYGHTQVTLDMMMRLIHAQVNALREHGHFFEYYHPDTGEGLGESGGLGGIVPLHLLNRCLGIRVISSAEVWTGGRFAWQAPVHVRQHGVTVTRTAEGSKVEFPSGHVVELEAGAEWQRVIDPQPVTTGKPAPLPAPEVDSEPQTSSGKVVIEVDVEE